MAGSAVIMPITPSFDSGWQDQNGSLRRLMTVSLMADALTNGQTLTKGSAGQTKLHRQYISQPLAAGNQFTTGTTFGCQIMGFESAANDNIINRVRCVKVISADGNTVQSTLIALGNASSVAEWNTSLRNLTFLNGTASTANYTTVAGDRLLLEVGEDDSSGVSVTSTMRFGADASGSGDLGVNETDTTTTLRPWFETSLNLVFESRPPAVVRSDAVHRSFSW